ncbi:alpha-1,2-glucosyltransferase ALG10-A [Cladochytrium replicatum]|nr:alpha-1,2-glucosyltransferase ALG10-A [Cladochytrium replicatum]
MVVQLTIALSGLAHVLFNATLSGPYMDEIFHIPQAQSFCRGDFSYDPKITTPPGLYLISAAILAPFGSEQCSAFNLRVTGGLFQLLIVFMIGRCHRQIHPSAPRSVREWTAANLAFFPVHFFSALLFYTDSGSTFFVLAAYSMALDGRHAAAALFGGISLWFRQTNVIWLVFITGVSVVRFLSVSHYGTKKKARFRDLPVSEITSSAELWKFVWTFVAEVIAQLPAIISSLWPYLLAISSFAVFVIWNKGIVIGDRSNHQPTTHFPQVLYFLAFSAFFAFPALNPLTSASELLGKLKSISFFISLVISTGLAFISVRYFTIHHPFLLSDNRHYTFYVWRLFRRFPTLHYLAIPGYVAAGWLCLNSLAQQQGLLWLLGYIAAVLLQLVPSPLMEFRYYILPYFMLRLHMPIPNSVVPLWIEFGLYAVVNLISIYLFVMKPFEWPSEPGKIQRFMW